ncbi:hypothetical protein CK203_026535 [Vitis vinifera]|uniref:Uncharacterized protein n=1 Tax=Vitis vinifera TaxID=29760 RepID=A0A438IWI2_VITVI|nr:hypothetical protein CK203_026535 [Vitis vinifera]
MASDHRKKTVGKRTTTESSPPGDRKIERRKRCITHPGFNIRASLTSAFKRPSSKLEASTRTRINISWDHRSHPRSMQPKRQSDRRSQLSNSMRARLGPQEPRRSRPPVATTWAPRPDPMATPMVQNVHPHRDPVVTPVMRNVHSHPAVQQAGETSQMSHPLAPSAEGWMICSPRPSALISSITSPQGDSSCQNFPHTMGPAILRSHHALSTTHDARYWQRCTIMQSISRQPTRTGPLMVSSSTSQLC